MKIDTEDWTRLICMVRNGEPLPPKARDWLAGLLEVVRRGDDAREYAGTLPKRGRPKESRAIVGMHYWALRSKYGRGGELAARKQVAQVWGLSADRVRKIGAATKVLKDGMERMARDKPDEVESMLASFAAEAPAARPHLRLVKKSR